MKTRNAKELCKKIVKKTYDRKLFTIRVLWPVIKNLQGQSNDFLFVILKTIVANRGLKGVFRVKQMMRGLNLKEKPKSWESFSSPLSPVTNWFTSCSTPNLDIIGPIVGYFLRTKANSFCQNLSPQWEKPVGNFANMNNILAICDKAIKPMVIEISAVKRTIERISQFVNISIDNLNEVKVNGECNGNRSVTFHDLQPEYHEWAWDCLNIGTVVALPNERTHVPPVIEDIGAEWSGTGRTSSVEGTSVIEGMKGILPPDNEIIGLPTEPESVIEDIGMECIDVQKRSEVKLRPVSARLKQRNKKYPLDVFDLN